MNTSNKLAPRYMSTQKLRELLLRAAKGNVPFREIEQRAQRYKTVSDVTQINKFQVAKFNSVWAAALCEIEFYKHWANEHNLPKKISNIQELADFPVLNKEIINNSRELIFSEHDSQRFYSTGGSTGEPTKFPKGKEDDLDLYVNTYVGRAWSGINPGDRFVHIWGHSHLFGQGRKATYLNEMRKVRDFISGGSRFNAYDQSVEATRKYIKKILQIRPKYLIGYTSAILRIAEVANDAFTPEDFNFLSTVVITSETVSSDELLLIQSSMGVLVSQEYGAAETGLIAHTPYPGASSLRVAWQSVALNVNEEAEVNLSTLDRRKFPLINYCMSDRLEYVGDSDSVLEISRVLGRSKDFANFSTVSGSILEINIVAIAQILKTIEGIRTVQVFQRGEGSVDLLYTSTIRQNNKNMESSVASQLSRGLVGTEIDPECVRAMRLVKPAPSRSGKLTLLVIDDTKIELHPEQ